MQPRIPSQVGDPAWEVSRFFPPQGMWREADYFRLHTNQMVELVAGRLDVLPTPTWLHQLIVDFLLTLIKDHLKDQRIPGVVLFAPLPIRLFEGTIREPDLLFVRPEHIPVAPDNYPKRIDLAVEVVSEGTEARERDYVDKRVDYAKARVPEYWIVDPEMHKVTILVLEGDEYRVACECGPGQLAQSQLFSGLGIDVDAILKLGAK